jgi:hypothetical protein
MKQRADKYQEEAGIFNAQTYAEIIELTQDGIPIKDACIQLSIAPHYAERLLPRLIIFAKKNKLGNIFKKGKNYD